MGTPTKEIMMLAYLAAASLAATQPIVHEDKVAHQGTSYQVSYRPHVTTSLRTIGMSAGSRPSTQQCRWTATIALDREIHSATGERLAKRLPGAERVIEGYQPGHCEQARRTVETQIAARIESERGAVLAMAQADRSHVLADIDAAHALALN